ncbi:YybH family protein [Mesorhizobium retamae]|uniref:Nuclear transport factor 2 family protein n=1 Tax=Mesorhizobium retamae TaxID=2912854 RepID=A0ABS9QMI1_9HYPH|nr:nuclear transport factor 2 family protein [Mesorhizobium sp. IRAMC:0171]MCG7508654.1 nuclear transport factor 2 family protein [Mesorhizobium sp. IRAMC:0171]
MSRKVYQPAEMNGAFAAARNAGNLDEMLSLYEADAQLLVDASGTALSGKAAIARELQMLIDLPGTMVSNNTFCVEHGDLALLRADFTLTDEKGAIVYSGFTAEIIRKQPDGSWRYVIDHAGASHYGTG